MPHAPVRIAGAGPSGLAAALVLARAGRAVELFERRTHAGARFGGDLQGLENWSTDRDVLDELRDTGFAIDFHAAPFSAGVQTDGVHDEHLAFDRPLFYLVKRGDVAGSLDRALARQAEAAGVRIRWGTPCPPGTADIDATGPRGRAPFAIDAGIVFETDASDQAIALLHDDAAPRGYAYLLVTQGYGCCCTMLYDDFPSIHARLATVKTRLLAQRGITVRDPRPVGGLGHVRAQGAWTDGAARRVGEAAGLQDFLWGFGIRLAIRSGALAARALLEGCDYARAAEATFAPVLRRGVVNRWLWETAGGGDYALVRRAMRTLGAPRLLRALHRDAWWSDALHPLASRALAPRYPALTAIGDTPRPRKATAPLAAHA